MKLKNYAFAIAAFFALSPIALTSVVDSAHSLPVGGTLYPETEETFTIQGVDYILRFQGDGNLVVYNKDSFYNGSGIALWASGTEGRSVEYVTYRQGELQLINRGQIVKRIGIGGGSQVCLSNYNFAPVGCN